MSRIAIAGAGAFGTSLAITLAREKAEVALWARDEEGAQNMQATRRNVRYLPQSEFPTTLTVSADIALLERATIVLLAVPTQHLRAFLADHQTSLAGKTCVTCCKGIEKKSGLLPTEVVRDVLTDTPVAVLTGPGFATEIARGLPTALTLATGGDQGAALQKTLSTETLRLYLSQDMKGAQLGGALKNVIAIACGLAIGAGLGESARAALMTRGYAEMQRLALHMGAKAKTLAGLSGFGDLVLTCSSTQSRNFLLGYTLGKGAARASGTTFEGVATAEATISLARKSGIEMPITEVVTAVLSGQITIPEATKALLSRPLRSET